MRVQIARGAKLNEPDYAGNYAIIVAAASGNTTVLSELVRCGADMNVHDSALMSCLHWACIGNHAGVVKKLIALGFDVNDDLCGVTALHYALQKRPKTVAKMLMSGGAHLDAPIGGEGGMTPLLLFCQRVSAWDDLSVLDYLVEHGVNVNATCGDGLSAILLAAESGNQQAVDSLLQAGANIESTNAEGETPLLAACRLNHKSVVKTLLKNGANPNAMRNDGATPITIAKQYDFNALVPLLKHATEKVLNRAA